MMAYLSIQGGATGVIYFLGGDMDAPYPSSLSVAPLVWGAVRAMATEVRELAPAFLHGPPQSVAVSLNTTEVRAKSWSWPAANCSMVAVLINTEARPTDVRLTVLPRSCLGTGNGVFVEVVNANRQLDVAKDGSVKLSLGALETLSIRHLPSSAKANSSGMISRTNMLLNPSFEDASTVGFPDGFILGGASAGLSAVDSTTAVDGAHSLRLVCPNASMVPWIRTYRAETGATPPIAGRNYTVSVWARSNTPGAAVAITPLQMEIPAAGNGSGAKETVTFNLTTEWRRYEVQGTAEQGSRDRYLVELHVLSVGVAWIDLIQWALTE